MVNGGNGTKAAIHAGYSAKTAHAAASRLLNDVKVREILGRVTTKVLDESEVDLATQVRRLDHIAGSDMLDIYDADGRVMHPKDWPERFRLAVAGFEIEELTEYDPDEKGRVLVGVLKKFKLWDKNAAIDKLIKVRGGYAAEKVDVSINDHAARLKAAIARRATKK